MLIASSKALASPLVSSLTAESQPSCLRLPLLALVVVVDWVRLATQQQQQQQLVKKE